MTEPTFKVGDRVRLIGEPCLAGRQADKEGEVMAVMAKGAALLVVGTSKQCKGDWMRYLSTSWEEADNGQP